MQIISSSSSKFNILLHDSSCFRRWSHSSMHLIVFELKLDSLHFNSFDTWFPKLESLCCCISKQFEYLNINSKLCYSPSITSSYQNSQSNPFNPPRIQNGFRTFERYSGAVVHFARVSPRGGIPISTTSSSAIYIRSAEPRPSFAFLRTRGSAEVREGGGRRGGESFLPSFLPSIDGRLRPNVTDPPSRGDAARFPRIIILLSYNSSNSWGGRAHLRQVCMDPRLHLRYGARKWKAPRCRRPREYRDWHILAEGREQNLERTFVTYERHAFQGSKNPRATDKSNFPTKLTRARDPPRPFGILSKLPSIFLPFVQLSYRSLISL